MIGFFHSFTRISSKFASILLLGVVAGGVAGFNNEVSHLFLLSGFDSMAELPE